MSWSDRRSDAARERERTIYNSSRWKKLRARKVESVRHQCQRCGRLSARLHVHHRIALEDGGDPFPKIDQLEALCASCHSSETLTEVAQRKRDEEFDLGSPDETGHRWGLSAEEKAQLKGR